MDANNLSNRRLPALSISQILASGFLLVLSVMAGRAVVIYGLSVKIMLSALIALVCVAAAMVQGQNNIRFVYYLMLFTFALGMRYVHPFSFLEVAPNEVLLWTLAAIFFSQRVLSKKKSGFTLPVSLKVFLGSLLLGLCIAYARGFDVGNILQNLKGLLGLVLTLFVVYSIVKTEAHIVNSIQILLFAAIGVAILGIIEYYFPSNLMEFSSFFGQNLFIHTQQGFTRSAFSFYGNPIASVFMAWMVPFSLYRLTCARHFFDRIVSGLGFVLLMWGIYVSGQRGAWVAAGISLVIFVFHNRGKSWAILVGYAVVLPFLPKTFYARAATLVGPAAFTDTSILKRIQRIDDAWALFVKSPIWGNGLGASGWVHNDFLQIGADVGVVALICFLYYYITLVVGNYRAFRLSKDDITKNLSVAFLSLLACGVVTSASQPVMVVPAVAGAFWLLVALASRWYDFRVNNSTIGKVSQNVICSYTHIQFRKNHRGLPRVRKMGRRNIHLRFF